MKIEVLYFEGCPNYFPTIDRLKAVLRQAGLPAEMAEIQVTDETAAERLKLDAGTKRP